MSMTFSAIKDRQFVSSDEDDLNVSNRNGADLLAFLGLPIEPYGVIDPVDLQERILVSNLRAVIEARNTAVEPTAICHAAPLLGSDGCLWIDCGRSQDAMDRYCGRLLALSHLALEKGAQVQWG